LISIPFRNQYVNLGDSFYVKTAPTPVSKPEMIQFNEALAQELGLSAENFTASDVVAIFAGNSVPEGAAPLAMAYAGHQFGHFVPQLGDGRAILIGEIESPSQGVFDLQLKGSGQTFYSRGGDGRAALGPVLREYLVSEAMAKLGVPTTRALAAVTSGEEVAREQLIPGGIITRVARSFVRVGTFQFFAARGDEQAIRSLADYMITRDYPRSRAADNPYLDFFQNVVKRQAGLIAQWMHLGFIHGVMNTDNMSIAGETIDYGPCAFMDHYAHDRVFSSIDRNGRYAYGNQGAIGLWNLTRLAETLLPLLADDSDAAVELAQGVLRTYADDFKLAWLQGMRAKFGLTQRLGTNASEHDAALIESLFNIMADNHADFPLTFYFLSRLDNQVSDLDGEMAELFDDAAPLQQWLEKWRERLGHETDSDAQRQKRMQAVNPVYIPRNHQIEAAIRAAEDHHDFSPFHELHEVLNNPYMEQEGKQHFKLPPKPDEVVQQTFCGT